MALDLPTLRDHPLPRAGPGCWHPLFPARIDDIWMLAATAIKYLEQITENGLLDSKLVVFEQLFENGEFLGVRRIEGGSSAVGS